MHFYHSTLAYNSNLMPPEDIYITKSCLNLLQSLRCLDEFVGTIFIHSEMGRAPNSKLRMIWRLPCHFVNTAHRLEMEGWRRCFVERRDTR